MNGVGHEILQKVIVAAMLCGISGMSKAEAWIVDVTVSYVNSKARLVENVPVLSLTVPVGQCVNGLVRTEKMIPKPVEVRQQICVGKSGNNKTIINGWMFAKDRITDVAFKDVLGALNYGQPVNLETDAGFVKFMSGHYTVSATRTLSQ